MPTSSALTKPTAITEIERLGFSFTEVAEYDLTNVDYNRRVQVREAKHYNPKELVERFAVQMGEIAFPPVVMTADGWVLDGNTRIEARRRLRKEKFSPAIVLDVAWEGATEKQRNTLLLLAATLNSNAGAALTAKEAREATKSGIALGWKAEQIARAIGIKPAGVSQVKREIDAEEKLARVGLSSNGDIRGASLRALGGKDVVSLNDVPYRELAKLAGDAGLNASEIASTAKEMRATGSDEAALSHVNDLRVELRDRIRERELTGTGKPPVSRQLRQHLGFIIKFHTREQELLETDPKVSPKHIETLESALAVLGEVLKLQKV